MAEIRTLHEPVMLETVVRFWYQASDGIYVDATYGRGGHSAALLANLGSQARLYLLDRDPEAVNDARERFGHDPRVHVVQDRFSRLSELARHWSVNGRVTGVLLDLGVSSPQLMTAARGFSFADEGPLDMRMDPSQGPTAQDWLSRVDEDELADVLFRFGEERYARRVARAIIEARSKGRLNTTRDLATVVARAVPRHEDRRHPATRTFQAIRILINGELEELGMALPQAAEILALSGRLLVISFHSLEDRIVKRFMRPLRPHGSNPQGLVPIASLSPDRDERRRNPRARSARLRVAEKRQESSSCCVA